MLATFKALFTGWRFLATLVVLLGVAVNIGLGMWQWNRHLQRDAVNQRVATRMAEAPLPLGASSTDSEQLDYRQVSAHGTYDPSGEIVLRNRSYGGALGVHVLTPLRLDDGSAVLIDRGWLPIEESEPAARQIYHAPEGVVSITGIARASQENAPGPRDPPRAPDAPRRDAWFRVDIPQIAQQTGYPLLPVFVELQPAADAPELPARSTTSDLGPGSHVSYTIQWFSFGAIMLGVYIAWTYQQVNKNR